MMKRRKYLLFAACLLAAMALASCHKTCSCIQYNGVVQEYTSDEVEEHGGSCYDMRIQANRPYYSYCEWK